MWTAPAIAARYPRWTDTTRPACGRRIDAENRAAVDPCDPPARASRSGATDRRTFGEPRNLQAAAVIVEKETGRRCAAQKPVAAPGVIGHDVPSGSVERNQAGLAELGLADGENALAEIHIRLLQLERLTDAQTCHRQQPEQAVVCPMAAGPGWEIASGPLPTAFESPVPNTDRAGRVAAETGASLSAGISVRGSVACQWRANTRTKPSRCAQSLG